MTFAVVGILGHFSKTLLLFFIPQIFNFLYSVPQLFHFVPCPRHRMPKLNEATGLLESSKTQFKYDELRPLGKLFVKLFRMVRLIEWNEDKNGVVTTNNFTLISLLLVHLGPTHEKELTNYLLYIQMFCTCVAFVIRYPLAKYFYEYWWNSRDWRGESLESDFIMQRYQSNSLYQSNNSCFPCILCFV